MDDCGTYTNIDFVSETSTYENNGIFDAGDYEYRVYDSWSFNPVLDGGASVHFQIRDVGSTDNQAWVNIVGTDVGTGLDHQSDNVARYFTVAAGKEMRIAYNCPGSYYDCYPGENTVYLKQQPAPPLLPAIGPGNAGSPTGSEPASVSFSVAAGEEAYFTYTSGSAPGDADHTEIYYRSAGATGWTNYWDICSVSPASTPPCQASTLYSSVGAL